MNAADILATLTEDDIADLEAVSDHTYSDDARLLRSIALGDDGRKLLGLGLVEERAPGRLAVTDDGLDVLEEHERAKRPA